jgi:hypothetical protein
MPGRKSTGKSLKIENRVNGLPHSEKLGIEIWQPSFRMVVLLVIGDVAIFSQSFGFAVPRLSPPGINRG